jgi:hypothetical protein
MDEKRQKPANVLVEGSRQEQGKKYLCQPAVDPEPLFQPVQIMVGPAALLGESVPTRLKDVQLDWYMALRHAL